MQSVAKSTATQPEDQDDSWKSGVGSGGSPEKQSQLQLDFLAFEDVKDFSTVNMELTVEENSS